MFNPYRVLLFADVQRILVLPPIPPLFLSAFVHFLVFFVLLFSFQSVLSPYFLLLLFLPSSSRFLLPRKLNNTFARSHVGCVYIARMLCVCCGNALFILRAYFVYIARMLCVCYAHALCMLRACFVYVARILCVCCAHSLCMLRAFFVYVARMLCLYCAYALCMLHAY